MQQTFLIANDFTIKDAVHNIRVLTATDLYHIDQNSEILHFRKILGWE